MEHVYTARVSVKEVYGVAGDGNSSSSGSNNSHCLSIELSPSRGRMPKARPCFVWKVDDNEVKILLCTTFSEDSPRDPKVFPEMSKEYFLSTLVLQASPSTYLSSLPFPFFPSI